LPRSTSDRSIAGNKNCSAKLSDCPVTSYTHCFHPVADPGAYYKNKHFMIFGKIIPQVGSQVYCKFSIRYRMIYLMIIVP